MFFHNLDLNSPLLGGCPWDVQLCWGLGLAAPISPGPSGVSCLLSTRRAGLVPTVMQFCGASRQHEATVGGSPGLTLRTPTCVGPLPPCPSTPAPNTSPRPRVLADRGIRPRPPCWGSAEAGLAPSAGSGSGQGGVRLQLRPPWGHSDPQETCSPSYHQYHGFD